MDHDRYKNADGYRRNQDQKYPDSILHRHKS